VKCFVRSSLTQIEEITHHFDGVMGVAIKDLTSGEEIFVNEELPLPTASSISGSNRACLVREL
jgi:beta-lactamase class A